MKDENGRPLQPAPPYELSLGLDWTRFNTPPLAGGLKDQPIRMFRTIKALLNTHNAIKAYRDANARLSGDALNKWLAANMEIVDFMMVVWSMEDDG